MKSEIFVIAFKGAESVKYAALDSRSSLIKDENPSKFKSYFTHEQAKALVGALKAKGLEEGIEVRVKSLAQAVRDYSWKVLQASHTAETTEEEVMARVIARYVPKVKEVETPAEVPAEPAPETTEEDLPA